MFNQTEIATGVAGWKKYGVKLPEDLTAAIELFNTVRWVEVGHRARFNLQAVTAENAEDKIREFALEIVVAGGPDQLAPAVLSEAKNHALEAAARNVNNQARSAIPSIIELLTESFDEHAEAYAEAVSRLPDDLTADKLVAAGADTVAAYHAATQQATALSSFHAWVLDAARVSLIHPTDTEKVLTLLRPVNMPQLARLDEAHRLLGVDPVFKAINPVWHAAVRHRIPFGINAPREASSLRQRLETSAKPVKSS